MRCCGAGLHACVRGREGAITATQRITACVMQWAIQIRTIHWLSLCVAQLRGKIQRESVPCRRHGHGLSRGTSRLATGTVRHHDAVTTSGHDIAVKHEIHRCAIRSEAPTFREDIVG